MKNKKNKQREFVTLESFEEVKKVIENPELLEEKKLHSNLFVKMPFRKYLKGQLITNQVEIDLILNSHEKNMVLKTNKK